VCQRTVPICAEEDNIHHAIDCDNEGAAMRTRILDRSFKYVPASQTNIRKTFARIRRELSQKNADADGIRAEQQAKVAKLRPQY
jgi:hypothetical protein